MQKQDDTLRSPLSSVDIATRENLENLAKVGEGLLKKPVSRVDLETGIFKPLENEGTNEEVLKRWNYQISHLLLNITSIILKLK